MAKKYVVKNLGEVRAVKKLNDKNKLYDTEIIVDKWSVGGDPEVTPTFTLRRDYSNNFYYVVHLTENIRHLFMPGWFEPMKAPVVAVALLKRNTLPRDPGAGAEQKLLEGTDLLTAMYNLEDVSVIRNWEWQNWYNKNSVTYTAELPTDLLSETVYKGATVKPKEDYYEMTGKNIYGGKWNSFENIEQSSNSNKIEYTIGNHYRTENLTIKSGSGDELKGSAKNALSLDYSQ